MNNIPLTFKIFFTLDNKSIQFFFNRFLKDFIYNKLNKIFKDLNPKTYIA